MIRKASRSLPFLSRLESVAREQRTPLVTPIDTRSTAGPSHITHVRHLATEVVSSTPRSDRYLKGKSKAVDFPPYLTYPKTKADKSGSDSGETRLLRPAMLSARVKKLCGEDKLDEAVELVKEMPLGAQNTIVWNTLMLEALKAGRTKLAYTLYIDMKRRGMNPTLRTYNTLFVGYGRKVDWTAHTKQQENVDALWEAYLELAHKIIRNGKTVDFTGHLYTPIQWYFRILGDSGQYKKLFDVYNTLVDGPLQPNEHAYSSLLLALGRRVPPPSASSAEREAALARNAADCRLIWRHMKKAAEKNPHFTIDSHIFTASLSILAHGRPSDHLFAFDLINEFFGLAKPGEDAPRPQSKLTHYVLTEILRFCNTARKYRLTIHYFSQVVDRIAEKKEASVINASSIEHVLRAYAALSAVGTVSEIKQALSTLQWMLREDALRDNDVLQPTTNIYTQVLIACWRGNDWRSVLQTFELMSGYNADDFELKQNLDSARPCMVKRSRGRNILPDVRAMSYIARTALATQDQVAMQQCLRIMEMLGGNKLLPSEAEEGYEAVSNRRKPAAFYDASLAAATLDLIRAVAKDTKQKDLPLTDEHQRWLRLKARAKDVLARKGEALKTLRPDIEEQPLGSIRGLAATESVVEQEFASRHLRPSKP